MKNVNEIMSEILDTELYEEDDVRACTLYKVPASMIQKCMKEYAKEVLIDFDDWKAHKTPDLVQQYIKEKGL